MAEPKGMDEAAKAAYDAARELIGKTVREGKTAIRFIGQACHELTHIPEEIAGITGLKLLNLDNTKISDLSAIAGQIGVCDLPPLLRLTELQTHRFAGSRVSDLRLLAELDMRGNP